MSFFASEPRSSARSSCRTRRFTSTRVALVVIPSAPHLVRSSSSSSSRSAVFSGSARLIPSTARWHRFEISSRYDIATMPRAARFPQPSHCFSALRYDLRTLAAARQHFFVQLRSPQQILLCAVTILFVITFCAVIVSPRRPASHAQPFVTEPMADYRGHCDIDLWAEQRHSRLRHRAPSRLDELAHLVELLRLGDDRSRRRCASTAPLASRHPRRRPCTMPPRMRLPVRCVLRSGGR